MTELADRSCTPCRGGETPLGRAAQESLLSNLSGGWKIVAGHHLVRRFSLPDFASALDLTNKVGAIAEEQGHHADIFLAWGKVEITIWTHAIDGLSERDFILAAKIDRIGAPDDGAAKGKKT